MQTTLKNLGRVMVAAVQSNAVGCVVVAVLAVCGVEKEVAVSVASAVSFVTFWVVL